MIRNLYSLLVLLTCIVLSAACKNEPTTTGESTGGERHPDANTTITDAPDGLDISNVAYLDAETFKDEMDNRGAVLIDVRMPGEFDQGHIEGAINMNFFDPMFKFDLLKLDRDKKYYLYCKNESRSRMTAAFMNFNDFPKVYVLQGGYEEWKEKGMN